MKRSLSNISFIKMIYHLKCVDLRESHQLYAVCAYFLIEFTDETHRSVLLFEKARFREEAKTERNTHAYTVPVPWKNNNNSIKKIFSRRLSFNFYIVFFLLLFCRTLHSTHHSPNTKHWELWWAESWES